MHPLRNLKMGEALPWWGAFTGGVSRICSFAGTAAATIEEKSSLRENDAMKSGIAKRLQIVASDDNINLAEESKAKIGNIMANIDGELSEEKGQDKDYYLEEGKDVLSRYGIGILNYFSLNKIGTIFLLILTLSFFPVMQQYAKWSEKNYSTSIA